MVDDEGRIFSFMTALCVVGPGFPMCCGGISVGGLRSIADKFGRQCVIDDQ